MNALLFWWLVSLTVLAFTSGATADSPIRDYIFAMKFLAASVASLCLLLGAYRFFMGWANSRKV